MDEQSLDLQIDALLEKKVKSENIYIDEVSGARSEREALTKLLSILREGDTLYVWKIDRMARSLIHFTKLINEFKEKGVAFQSITERFLDTTSDSSHGNFLMNIFAALAEFESDLIRERTKAGLEAAKRRGKKLGPPSGLSEKAKQKAVVAAAYHKEGKMTVDEILDKLQISRGTYYKYLDYHKVLTRKHRVRKNVN
jgi:DNA invertase Pin-like site-specific DNA recombinase